MASTNTIVKKLKHASWLMILSSEISTYHCV